MSDNTLFFGDNLDILRNHVGDETIDLIYLDPPFNSNQAYNVFFEEQNGSGAGAQIQAFDDTWHWTRDTAEIYRECVEAGGSVSEALVAFRDMLGTTDMMAYLANMAPRLVELRRVLKPTGSLYLHCDQTASHYLKILMDAIFGVENFLNNVVWLYGLGGSSKRYWPKKHDDLLWYSKEPDEHYFEASLVPAKSKRMEGALKKAPDYWDIPAINNMAKERLGYPTQKPEALLERVIESSSREGDLVLDPFCGCGTTIAVAHRLNRRWIGVDITHIAVNLMKYRLQNTYGQEVREEYEVIGEPTDLAGAAALAEEDRQQFEFWALGLVGVPPAGQTGAGADEGIDGKLTFLDNADEAHQIMVSVKSGKVSPSQIRDLRGVVEREGAAIGVFVTLHDPTVAMETEANAADFWSPQNGGVRADGEQVSVPRIQILTIEELLSGAQIECPYLKHGARGFKKAPRHQRRIQNERMELEE